MSEEVVTVKGKGLARIVGATEDGRTVFVKFFSDLSKTVQVKSHEIEPYGE
jgi:hypothetical protein